MASFLGVIFPSMQRAELSAEVGAGRPLPAIGFSLSRACCDLCLWFWAGPFLLSLTFI